MLEQGSAHLIVSKARRESILATEALYGHGYSLLITELTHSLSIHGLSESIEALNCCPVQGSSSIFCTGVFLLPRDTSLGPALLAKSSPPVLLAFQNMVVVPTSKLA